MPEEGREREGKDRDALIDETLERELVRGFWTE